jgi:hypothetical protein
MLGIPATARLFCTTRIGRALLCDLTARSCMQDVAIGSQMRTFLCTCRLYELPTLDSFYEKTRDPWLSPPPVAFLDRECLARANQAREQLRHFCSTPGGTLDPSCVCLVAAATPPFTVQYVSAGWTTVVGHCLEEVLDTPCLNLLHGPGTCRSTLNSLDAALHESRVVTVQLVLYTHAAPRLPLSATVQLVRIRTAAGAPEDEGAVTGAAVAPRPEAMGLICSNVTRIDSKLGPILFPSWQQRSPVERGGARSLRAKGASSQEMPPPPPRPPKRSREVGDAEQQPP